MSKSYRQGQILKLIRAKPIYTQDELAMELKAEGIAATQVTLSRDLRDLQLVKTGTGYQQLNAPDDDDAAPPLGRLLANFLRDARLAQNQVVLKTDPGHASIIAVALDNEDWPEIVGTIAGDDTVLIIATDTKSATKLRQRLLDFLE
jgi:transcriptional regulator of arginine metabolism